MSISRRGVSPELRRITARAGMALRSAKAAFQALFPRFSTAHAAMDDGQEFRCHRAFGPWLATPDAVPPGAQGLRIQGRLNGRLMQDSRTDLLIFSVPALIEMISVAMSLEPGDVIITGTPGGVGAARKPPVFMKSGDVFEVEIEGIGVLSNPVQDE